MKYELLVLIGPCSIFYDAPYMISFVMRPYVGHFFPLIILLVSIVNMTDF